MAAEIRQDYSDDGYLEHQQESQLFDSFSSRKLATISLLIAFAIVSAALSNVFALQYRKDYFNAGCGVIDLKGNWIIETKYNFICRVPSNNTYWVSNLRPVGPESISILGHGISLPPRYQWKQLDTHGKVLLPPTVLSWGNSQFGTPHVIEGFYHWGIGEMDESGFPLLDSAGTECRFVGSDRWVVKRDGRYPFAEFQDFVNSFYLIFTNPVPDREELYDSLGHKICDLPGDCMNFSDMFSEGLLPIASFAMDKDNNHLQGAINVNGETVVPMRFIRLGSFHEGLAAALFVGSKTFSLVNKSGVLVKQHLRAEPSEFVNGLAVVSDSHGKYGVIDRSEKVVIPLAFDDIGWRSDGTIWAKNGTRVDVFSTNGKAIKTLLLSSKNLSTHLPPGEDIATDQSSHEYWIIDADGKTVSQSYASACHVTKDLIAVSIKHFRKNVYQDRGQMQSKAGIVDVHGKWLLPPIYRDLLFCSPDRFIASKYQE